MSRILEKLFDVREGEALKTFLMFSYIFLVIASIMIIKPVRNSLFLTHFGVSKLPFAFVLVALGSAILISIYTKYSKSIPLNRVIRITLLISVSSFIGFWYLLSIGYKPGWFLYAIYLWVALYGVTTTTQFWLLANYVFNSREAKRLFSLIGAGGISGAIFGGYLTNYLAPILGTENLIFICVVFLLICIVILQFIWKMVARYNYRERLKQQKRMRRTDTTDSPFQLIRNSSHLTFLASLVGVAVIVANLVDYQFSALASESIKDGDELTAFFGFWLSNLSLISLVIQLFVTGKVLEHFGVGASLFFLPIGILTGAFAVLIYPGIISVLIIKVTDGSFKHSINKAALELLSLPIPVDVKNRVKAYIDVLVENIATGIGGLLLILFTVVLNFPVQYISFIAIGLIAIWFFVILRVKTEYVNSFRLALDKRSIDLEEESLNLKDATIFKSLLTSLETDNERQILYVLRLLEKVTDEELEPFLEKFIEFPSAEVRSLVLRIALNYKNLDLSHQAEKLVQDIDQEVKVAAIRYLSLMADEIVTKLQEYLDSDDFSVRVAALLCAAEETRNHPDLRERLNFKDQFDRLFVAIDDPSLEKDRRQFLKANAAKIIGIVRSEDLFQYLYMLIEDESIEVLKLSVTSAGRTQAEEFVPLLIPHLVTRNLRKEAREALAEYGENIIETLIERMNDEKEDRILRLGIPKVLALIGSQKSADNLLDNIIQDLMPLRHEIIKSLNQLKINSPELSTDSNFIREMIASDALYYKKLLTIHNILNVKMAIEGESQTPEQERTQLARKLLVTAIEERIRSCLEVIFRLLALIYPATDMNNAYSGIISKNKNLRSDAIEFLDNLLETNLKRIIIPIAEAVSHDMDREFTTRIFIANIKNEEDCLSALLEGEDSWLKVCTIYLMASFKDRNNLEVIKRYVDDKDPLLRETAGFAVQYS